MGSGIAFQCPSPLMLSGISSPGPSAWHVICLVTFLTYSTPREIFSGAPQSSRTDPRAPSRAAVRCRKKSLNRQETPAHRKPAGNATGNPQETAAGNPRRYLSDRKRDPRQETRQEPRQEAAKPPSAPRLMSFPTAFLACMPITAPALQSLMH